MNLLAVTLAAAAAAVVPCPPYDEAADARREIASSLQVAQREHRSVLLTFGANWCPWCRRLDKLLCDDPALSKLVEARFLRVNVDIGDYDKNLDLAGEYGLDHLDDTGIPMLVVLTADGRVAVDKNSDDFVSGQRFVNSRILRFLEAYAVSQAAPSRFEAAPPEKPTNEQINSDYVRAWSERIAGRENEPASRVFRNIQLPWFKHGPAALLLRVMEDGYARALGVACTHCHVEENFASDEQRPKRVARGRARSACRRPLSVPGRHRVRVPLQRLRRLRRG